MIESTFNVPVAQRYFEDYVAGSVHEFGSVTISEADIIAFAQQFDPQDFHTDPVAAQQSVFGGLIASGWHTGSLVMRLYVGHYLSHVASLGSPGIDELRWNKSVRPGDELAIRVTVLETRRSQSKPDRGIVRSFIEVLNQHGEVVMSMKPINLLRCRTST